MLRNTKIDRCGIASAKTYRCGIASAKTYAPGALHHIVIRGIKRKANFKGNAEQENFAERLGRIISETEIGCFAWV